MHTPKTGGMWMKHLFQDHAPVEWQMGRIWWGHRTHGQIPVESRNKPHIWFVRNPWEWWVSYWRWWSDYEQSHWQRQLKKQCLSDAHARWKSWLKKDSSFGGIVRQLIQMQHGQSSFVRLAAHPVARRNHVGRYETLREDLLRFVTLYEPVPDAFRDGVLYSEPFNTSKHGHYRDYYDNKTRRMVADFECLIVKEYGYRF